MYFYGSYKQELWIFHILFHAIVENIAGRVAESLLKDNRNFMLNDRCCGPHEKSWVALPMTGVPSARRFARDGVVLTR